MFNNDGLPILLVPGLLSTARVYAGQMPVLRDLGDTMVVDHTRDDTIEAIARRALAAAPPIFAVAGLSMGGYVALEMVRQAPGRVRRMALLGTTARPDTSKQTVARLGQIAEAEARGLTELGEAVFSFIVHPNRTDNEGLRATFEQMAAETGVETFVRQQKAIISRPDARPHLGAIRCPTLVLVGREDALAPVELSAEIAQAVGHARLVVVPTCGHLSTLECPRAVGDALADWLCIL